MHINNLDLHSFFPICTIKKHCNSCKSCKSQKLGIRNKSKPSHLTKSGFSGHIGFWCHQKTAEIAEIVEKPPYISCLRLYPQSRPRTLTKEFLHSISHPALSKNGVNSVKSVKTPGRFVTSCPLCPRSRVLGIARELATGQSLFTITERSLRLR